MIKSYWDWFVEVKLVYFWNVFEIKEFLYKVGVWGKVRDIYKEGVIFVGLFLFSEEWIIIEVLL